MPDIDGELVHRLLDEHISEHGVRKALFFGHYEHIARTQAACAAGLVSSFVLSSAAFKVFDLSLSICAL